MIVFEDVTKTYDPDVVGLQDFTCHIGKGEFVFLVGASGFGEIDADQAGTQGARPGDGAHPRRRPQPRHAPAQQGAAAAGDIGCVFQDFKLLPNKTIFDNVAYALEVVGEPRRSIRRKVPEILSLVGLADKTNSYPHEISGGEQQRVSVARAFVNHPPLLLADEPTGNIDPETAVGIMQLLVRINRTGTTVLVATHDRDMVNRMRRRVLQLDTGRLVRDERRGGYDQVADAEEQEVLT